MTDEALDRRLMERALAEAVKGRPSPNPHVGAVIARGGEVVALGHHARAGQAHAEIDAIRKAEGDTDGATLYCTLEPCNHFGRTPPCTDAILEAGFARVVIGCADPAPHVPGAVDKLRAAGVEVTLGVHEERCRNLIADFTKHIVRGLPYAILKAAVTLDGRIATSGGDSRWITGEASRVQAHHLRDRADAVLVGVNTVIADDPELTVRHLDGHNPTRAVFDTHLRTPLDAKLVLTAHKTPTWVVHGPSAPDDARRALSDAGVALIEVSLHDDGRLDPEAALRAMAARDVVRLLVEGGARVHGALLRAGLYDEAAVFVAPRLLGDPRAQPLADAGPLAAIADGWRIKDARVRTFGADVLFEGALVSDRADPHRGDLDSADPDSADPDSAVLDRA
ncbi:MAG: bifunctional diaminohydroxyphosphoribosylaminopyrimidine deaminase/5-amino-6-(5-phosphoribosylamino)uracil reductase RibD [Sandaracinaceae bacterium]